MIAASSLGVWAFWIGAIAVGAALSAFFAGMETGIYVLNKIRLDLHAETGRRPARRIRALLARPNNLLAVLLIGVNLSGYFTALAASNMFFLAGFGHKTEWMSILVATPVLFIFGESVPKNVFQRVAESLVYRFSAVLGAANVLFNACGLAGLVRGFSWVLVRLARAPRRRATPLAHEGLAALVSEGHASGVLTHAQSVMADRVMRIGSVTLGDVMKPMGKVAKAPETLDRAELLELLRKHDYSRLPLLDAAGHVAGIVDVYDFLAAGDAARPAELLRPPLVLDAAMSVTDALYRMQRAKVSMVVVAAGEKHAGIATVKDIVEEIVGEIEEW
ncbi:MAG TPA: hypothetical protein DCX07_12040 [Phycisphaerales bacterium]|nr:hypothetical protein [Phycisphaerales bacterium]